MRLLLINSEYPPVGGGASNASAHIARSLVKMGHEVVVLTSRPQGFDRETVEEGVRVVRCRAPRQHIDRSGALEQLAFMLMAIPAAWRVVRKWRPDATIAFFGIPSGPAAWVLKKLFAIPFIVSLRGGDVPGFRPNDFRLYHTLTGPLIRFIWDEADSIVANSAGLRRLAVKFDNKVKVVVVPNGVSLRDFTDGQRDWVPAQVIIVGRLVFQKGIDLLLRALSGLTHLDWQLDIVGDGPSRESLEAQVDDYGLGERVAFSGWLEKPILREHLAAANLFAYPSRDEGMPNAMLEAMAAGLPIIASHIAGNEELVTEGENGLLVPVEDVESLREALGKLMPDVKTRERFGAASRSIVERTYSWERTTQGYVEIIEDLQKKD
jgi:glycosyltransferase involved in cell wall biosynthesis